VEPAAAVVRRAAGAAPPWLPGLLVEGAGRQDLDGVSTACVAGHRRPARRRARVRAVAHCVGAGWMAAANPYVTVPHNRDICIFDKSSCG
jgi:hypothetical protein